MSPPQAFRLPSMYSILQSFAKSNEDDIILLAFMQSEKFTKSLRGTPPIYLLFGPTAMYHIQDAVQLLT